ncbi:CUE domain-containing protein 2 [Colias croceus]|uniref:CUE domain-containing protein 2 n=1 Tax=Colias crocea TaxID=72248 RepID=UPI001E27F016|nr:CUE domain-containing protein 2 [Colias croceus]XP_045508766.1 CUE domain-containing protein 2 [Colias croceus]
MSAIAQQESFIKASLFHFIEKNVPSANLTVIDEIVLSYVTSILELASQDSCFDVEGFMEFMAGYIPGFENINTEMVYEWLVQVEADISRRDESDSNSNQDDSAGSGKISLNLLNLNGMLPTSTKNNRSHSNSESSECAERRPIIDTEEYAEQCRALTEMFPNTCAMEIKHCVSIACGDPERAAATLLHRREQGQSLSAAAIHTVAKQPLCDDHEIKNRIIARYSYVDKDAETKEHKPLAPKIEPKKMVRYRDNKIVSLKGERYTEVPKSGIDEEHLKKPKKQHCP